MEKLWQHVKRSLVAGIVALLPVGGTILGVVYLETTISESWRKHELFYFPGLGLLAVAVLVYAIGLTMTTFLGRWLWTRADRMLDRLPVLGGLYQTLKQILGYGSGPDALFKRVVLVPSVEGQGHEVGLVTTESDGALSVFVPTAPNPTVGRLVELHPSKVAALDVPVSQALQTLVSLGSVQSPSSAATKPTT